MMISEFRYFLCGFNSRRMPQTQDAMLLLHAIMQTPLLVHIYVTIQDSIALQLPVPRWHFETNCLTFQRFQATQHHLAGLCKTRN